MDLSKKYLIIAPHPDDEILGCGGTINKIIKNKGQVAILTICNHMPPLYKKKDGIKTLEEMKKVHNLLGIKRSTNLKFPACLLFKEPQYQLNNLILKELSSFKPDYVFIPFPDRHQDHKITFECSMVATRPKQNLSFVKGIFAYEVISETHWNSNYIEPNFQPDFHIDISNDLKMKLKCLSLYKSQISNKVPERSKEAIESLAKFRGSQNGFKAAESYKLIRFRLD